MNCVMLDELKRKERSVQMMPVKHCAELKLKATLLLCTGK